MTSNGELNVTQKRHFGKAKQVTIFCLSLAVLIPAVGYLTSAKKPTTPTEVAVPVDTNEFRDVSAKARAGDYQAQRNLAYGYAAEPYAGQEKNPVLACAWYLVISNSGSQKLNAGDASNTNLYCGRLEPELLETAKARATQLLAEIYRR